jgi:hypothetical protein
MILLLLQSALMQCCLQLKSKIVKKLQARERQDRKRNLNRYILLLGDYDIGIEVRILVFCFFHHLEL